MKKVLMAAILASSIVLPGCSPTIYTPGTRSSDTGSVAKLTASNVVGGRNYNGYAVATITIDGVSYRLKEKPTTFVLTAGTHEVGFTYSTDGGAFKNFREQPRPLPPRTYSFQALPGKQYELTSFYSSSGLTDQIRTQGNEHVLKPLQADAK